ncbi:MAG: thioesterase [Alphaproteobacteria bacterium]|nr:thioesterase [Alphaproteobacteria bacterium]
MNLFFRVLYVFLRSLFAPRINPLEVGHLPLRVLLNDLDTNGHMNNGRYLTIMDLGRLDYLLRSGLWRFVMKHKGVPILGAATIRYRLSLDPFHPFDLQTRVLCWDEKWFYLEQKFVLTSGEKAGAVAAVALVKGSFWADKKLVQPQVIVEELGVTTQSPPMPEAVVTWKKAEDALKASHQ